MSAPGAVGARAPVETRAGFRSFREIQTRLADNDVYGHVNNVVYYAYFDTAVNLYLIESGWLDMVQSPVIGLAVETGCRYISSVAFPDRVTVGIRVARLGRTSVRYEIGLFRNDEDLACAQGHFAHVYVERRTQRPVPLPGELRTVLAPLVVEGCQSGAMRSIEPGTHGG